MYKKKCVGSFLTEFRIAVGMQAMLQSRGTWVRGGVIKVLEMTNKHSFSVRPTNSSHR